MSIVPVSRTHRIRRRWGRTVLLALGLCAGIRGHVAFAQEPAAPIPPLPAPAPPADTIEARLQKLEALNERMIQENAALREQVRVLSTRMTTAPAAPGVPRDLEAGPNIDPEMGLGSQFGLPTNNGSAPAAPPSQAQAPAPPARPPPTTTSKPDPTSTPRWASAATWASPPSASAMAGPTSSTATSTRASCFETEDEEFLLRFSNETQVESIAFNHSQQGLAHNGIYIPRQIWSFSGRITKLIEYNTSINKGLGSINLRDAYLNLHFDDRFMVRYGRYRVPYTYEFYANSNVELLAPERSVFAVNYGLNRMIGFMGWGELFDKRLDYAVGGFNGPRNGFEDTNGSEDIIAYLNGRPFEKSERLKFLRFLNIGGSVDYGNQNNPLLPQALRTAVNASNGEGAAGASPTFLIFDPTVTETGNRELWNLHLAYFYKSFTLLGEWDQGYTSYAKGARNPVQVPLSGWYVQAGYVLTGEELEKRTVIAPKHPFNLKPGKFGLGAFEVHSRYANLNVGREVFTYGLSDPNLWSNSAGVIDTGLNWYLNRYLKIYFDWQHSMFGNPIYYAPGGFQKTADMYWFRVQLYF